MLDRIKKLLQDVASIDVENVSLESNLKDDLDIDSLAAVELGLELESEFDLTIDDEELANLTTVQDIVDLISSKE